MKTQIYIFTFRYICIDIFYLKKNPAMLHFSPSHQEFCSLVGQHQRCHTAAITHSYRQINWELGVHRLYRTQKSLIKQICSVGERWKILRKLLQKNPEMHCFVCKIRKVHNNTPGKDETRWWFWNAANLNMESLQPIMTYWVLIVHCSTCNN